MDKTTEQTDWQDDLLISYLVGEATPEQAQQVEIWCKADAGCNRRLAQFRTLWEASNRLQHPNNDDAREALSRFRTKAQARNMAVTPVRLLKSRLQWLSVAAVLLILAVAAYFFILQHRVQEIYLTTTNSTQATTLPDGSMVTLNHRSHFEYPSAFKGNQRRVKLNSGEAFFNVAHNKVKPFIITAGNTQIRVVGTSFNVKKHADQVEVIVETGLVEVTNNHQTVRIAPGEKLLISHDKSGLKKEANPDRLYNYYRTKVFEAQDTPLWRVVEVLNEAYDSHIIIARNELRDLPLNTTFKNESLDKILDIISRTFNITVQKEKQTIILK